MSRDEREYIFDPSGDDEESPVADVIEVTSRKWTRSIVERLLADEPMRYNELGESIDGISDKVLSETLEDLEAYGLVHREVVDDRPVKVEYSLTRAGRALEDVIDAVAAWTEVYLEQVGDRSADREDED
jgi:DNA-binding HxlR family transcriptional regulator